MQNMPIAIFRGDDTDALGYQTIVGTIKTDLDLTGCKAVFKYLSFSVEFNPIPENKKLTVIIPASETKKLPPGLGYASLRVYDAEGKLCTFSNRIMVFVATKTPMFGNEEFEVDFNVRPELEPLKIFVGPNPDDFDEYRGFLEKVIDRASAAKYGLAMLLDAIDSDLGADDGVAATPVAVKAAYAAVIKKLTDDYYTKEETDEAIDKLAAYYITYNAAGDPFPTYAALANATTVYSGGEVRTPTRNDYAVVLADEEHQGAEYRYIYAVAEGQTTGRWQPQYPVEGVMTVDQTVVKDSHNPVSGGGVWSMLWGTLWSIPGGVSSVYAWVLNRLGLKRDLTDMACTVDVAGIPQIGSGMFVVTSPSGTSTMLNPFESSDVRGWGSYRTYPYIFARASYSYDIIFGLGISDIIPLNMTAETQTVTYNAETWTVDAYTGATVNTRLANMTDIPAASESTPQMDGTGAAGTSAAFARGDHVHPSDTSRMAASATGADIPVDATVGAQKINAALAGKVSKSGDTMTGMLTAPSLTVGARGTGSVGNGSVAEGSGTVASGTFAHAEGLNTVASDRSSHAEGVTTKATGSQSHAEGFHTSATNPNEHAEGSYNASHTSNNESSSTLHSIGIGTSDNDRRNAVETMRDGKTFIHGIGGYDGTNPTATGVKDLATAVNDKANRASPATAGNLAALDASGNLTDSGVKPSDKLDSTSAAPAFSTSSTYAVGEHVTYNGALYRCTTAVTTAGAWDASKWTADMASNYFQYALVAKTINNGAVTLDDRAINAVAVSSSLASLTVNFPTATSGKARDFGLRLSVASGITTAPQIVLPQGVTCENADGEAPEIGADGAATILYFTETASGVFLVKGEVLQTITA